MSRKTDSPHVIEQMYFTVKEWIILRIEFVENDVDKLMKYYTAYLNADLMNILEGVLKSARHRSMARTILQVLSVVSFESCDNGCYLKPYYDLMKELEAIGLQYGQW